MLPPAVQQQAMMRVRVDEAAERDFTKDYADACWRANPRISPDSWRLSRGFTTGKLWFDGRAGGAAAWEETHARGVNGVVASAATLAGWQQELGSGEARAACVLGCMVEEVAAVPTGVDFVLWQTNGVTLAELVTLERAVATGQLQGYGFWIEEVAALDWAAVAELAKAAAAEAWGRRKRPAWQMLALPLGIGARAALAQPVWTLGRERVSLLEGAARHDLLVLAQGMEQVALPGGDWAPREAAQPTPTVIAQLTMVAEQEAVLVGVLGGWPQRGGSEVFSVLRHLQAGVPLWPGAAAWGAFMAETLPALKSVWTQVATQQGQQRAVIEGYLAALTALAAAADAAGLVRWGAAQWARLVQQQLAAVAPPSWNGLTADEQAAAAVASMPAVTGVLGTWTPAVVERLMAMPSMPDAGVFFAKQAGNRH